MQLALVQPFINEPNGTLDLTAPEMPLLKIPLAQIDGEQVELTLWGAEMRGVVQSEDINKWFSDFLKVPVRLVRCPPDHERVVDKTYTVASGSQHAGYSDGFPYLIANENSLTVVREATIQECGSDPITIKRFRPNILVTGFPAWQELIFEKAQVGSVTLHLTKPCTRCKLTTVIPDKGIFGGSQPLQYIRSERKSIFGMNAIHTPASKGKIVKIGEDFIVNRFRSEEIIMK